MISIPFFVVVFFVLVVVRPYGPRDPILRAPRYLLTRHDVCLSVHTKRGSLALSLVRVVMTFVIWSAEVCRGYTGMSFHTVA